MDIISPMQQCLEIGRDKQDCAAVGQTDIQNYHDSIHRYAVLQALRRRAVNRQWALAAVRIQRMPQIALRVKGAITSTIRRCRGAITGNCLAALFGQMIVEDVFLKVHGRIRSFAFNHEDIDLYPMAWSDNMMVFGNSITHVAKTFAVLEYALWEVSELRSKEGSAELVPASSQKFVWPCVKTGNVVVSVGST